jgi:tRNA uridine 5-carboxymethylaminomethyl modification enzyme
VDERIAEQFGIEVRYEGYINKAKREAAKLAAMDHVILPDDLDYQKVDNLSIEGRQKLSKFRPATMGQASRISGVNPADLAVLAIYLKSQKEVKSYEL